MLLGKYRIQGHSMMPELKPGETIIASSVPYLLSNPRIGDIILFKKNHKTLIKRINKISKDAYYIAGDNKNDTLGIGKINKSDIIGKLVFKI